MNSTLIVNVHQAKTQFSRLLEQAHLGQEIILAKAGKPYARMLPLAPDMAAPRRPGQLAHLLPQGLHAALFDPLPAEELAAWEGP